MTGNRRMKSTAIGKSRKTFCLSSPESCLSASATRNPPARKDYRDDEDEVVEALQGEPAGSRRRGAVDGGAQGRLVEKRQLHYQLEHLVVPVRDGHCHRLVRKKARPREATRLRRSGDPVG